MARSMLFASVLGLLLLSCLGAAPRKQESSSKESLYDKSKWVLVKRADIALDGKNMQAFLLKSAAVTDRTAADVNDVQLLITENGQSLYDWRRQRTGTDDPFFMDDDLIVKNISGRPVPEIIFHSGTVGVSDYDKVEHILQYDHRNRTFRDIAPPEFYESGTHGLKWLALGGHNILVISERGKWTVPVEKQCHYCASWFVFQAWGWGQSQNRFVTVRTLNSRGQHSGGPEALQEEWPYIRGTLSK